MFFYIKASKFIPPT